MKLPVARTAIAVVILAGSAGGLAQAALDTATAANFHRTVTG